ncbi:metallophosphoesterase [Legionella jordanis]|uniref:3',5'-cyclic adenosine monophosphate phosphodiesterase CpdA n=1 Tax=Legionella jordanis TaxID=456 RepID=A0A0W0V7Z4_9GAMM|nr:metallophosphoesterase [Legionella jordanis]KTD16238.1 3',5'-cyclic adenosine monophosphate phosphodiesterase CpdA [Legionella jordanis]RMX04542.1 hypothetical protein EAW55_03665 [Legionella jordanis]VEH12304.1 3',5'-cyclic adenosine monophosphate phosphodiesterase CpdA [Legionella jordanis]HAT8713511.1 hypothetical protein [Legionella jordanis]
MITVPPTTLVQLSDIHYSGDNPLKGLNKLPAEGLQQVLKHLEENIPGDKTIILTGDLVDSPEPAFYEELASIFKSLPHKVLTIPGNHDSLEMMEKHLFGHNIFSSFSLTTENWLILLCDTNHPTQVEHAGRIISKDLQALEQALMAHPNQNALIFMHHPPVSFGAAWFKQIILENAAEFNSTIERFEQVKAIIFGHAHTEFSLLRQKKLYLGCPSTWIQFNHSLNEQLGFTAAPSAYMSYRLYRDGSLLFQTHYCWP